jgi:hypothetical protein
VIGATLYFLAAAISDGSPVGRARRIRLNLSDTEDNSGHESNPNYRTPSSVAGQTLRPVQIGRRAMRGVISCLPAPLSARPTAIEPRGRYLIVEPTSATLEAQIHGIPSVNRPVVLRVHSIIDRHGATLNTALILVLAFVVSIHFPGHGVAVYHSSHGR